MINNNLYSLSLYNRLYVFVYTHKWQSHINIFIDFLKFLITFLKCKTS